MGYNYASAFAKEIDRDLVTAISIAAVNTYREEFTAAGKVTVAFIMHQHKVMLTSEGGVPREYTFEELGFKA